MTPSQTEIEAVMPEIESAIVDALNREPAPGTKLIERLPGFPENQVRHAIWHLLDRGRLELTWQSKLRVIEPRRPVGVR